MTFSLIVLLVPLVAIELSAGPILGLNAVQLTKRVHTVQPSPPINTGAKGAKEKFWGKMMNPRL